MVRPILFLIQVMSPCYVEISWMEHSLVCSNEYPPVALDSIRLRVNGIPSLSSLFKLIMP